MQQTKFAVTADEVPVKKLKLHAAANRDLRPTRVKFLEKNMDLDALGRFAVWSDHRNLYVIDGQHRKIALEGLGLHDWPVRCDIYRGMSFAQACEQFLKLNDSLTVHPYDKFDKGVKAGIHANVETKKVIENVGLKVSAQSRDGNLSCVAAALETWRIDEGESLSAALEIAVEAWGHTSAAVEGPIVKGLGLVAARYNGELDQATLVKKLAKFPGGPPALRATAKQQREYKGGTMASNVSAVVVDLYNRSRYTRKLQTP